MYNTHREFSCCYDIDYYSNSQILNCIIYKNDQTRNFTGQEVYKYDNKVCEFLIL